MGLFGYKATGCLKEGQAGMTPRIFKCTLKNLA